MHRFFTVLTLACFGGWAQQGGGASYDMKEAPPSAKQTINVHISTSTRSNPNSPTVYQVPQSNTFIAVHANISRGADAGVAAGVVVGGVVGGVLALAIASSGYSEAKDWTRDAITGNEKSFTMDLGALASSILDARIKERAAGKEVLLSATAPVKGTPSLSLLPYVVLAYISKSTLRPYAFVDAVLKDESESEIWQARYISGAKEDRTLTGENGWGSDSGKTLTTAVAQALEQALDTVVRDFSGKLPRTGAKDATIKMRLPSFAHVEIPFGATLIESSDKTAVFVYQPPARNWVTGVYSLPKELLGITIRDR